MKSVWSEIADMPEFRSLNGDIKTDVLIIGGGMSGILSAYKLKQSGVDCVLVEAKKICRGITGNTTAKITSQHGLIYDKLVREFGADTAGMYLEANEKAVKAYREMCRNIDCDFENKDNYVYTVDKPKKIEDEINALHRIGFRTQFSDKLPMPFSTAGAVKFSNQAQFNPLKFISSIADGLNIYEDTTVRELIGTTAVTDSGRITAEKIIVATHFPFINKHGSYFIKMYQHRSYVIALENAKNYSGMYVDEAKKGMSFRNYDNLLFVGGGGHRTGKDGGNYTELEAFAKEYYPDSDIKYRWATQDCMTLDNVPYIGRYSKRTDNMYVATGFNKWGMTSSMVAADILCDMVRNKRNEYEEVFSPSRTVLRPQLAANAFEAVVNLLTPTAPRCPHVGCALKWNKEERSWDCPCHGSRFEENGQLIDNPATGDLKKKQ